MRRYIKLDPYACGVKRAAEASQRRGEMETYLSMAQGWVTETSAEGLKRLRALLFQDQGSDSVLLSSDLLHSSSFGADDQGDTVLGRVMYRFVSRKDAQKHYHCP